MPELPEVETSRRGIEPYLVGQTILYAVVRNARLRWPVSDEILALSDQPVLSVQRRAKYLLLELPTGWIIVHLGMSGSLRILSEESEAEKHDHVDLVISNGKILRYTDPRRFGAMLWSTESPLQHRLLQKLGPEPLLDDFSVNHLYECSRGRSIAVKPFIMDNAVVVGVGNIYASEALFAAGIDPRREAGSISKARYAKLTAEIKRILAWAIEQGGTTLRDFVGGDGKPGYFQQKLFVYGRSGQPCLSCATELREIKLGQRASVYCLKCQR